MCQAREAKIDTLSEEHRQQSVHFRFRSPKLRARIGYQVRTFFFLF